METMKKHRNFKTKIIWLVFTVLAIGLLGSPSIHAQLYQCPPALSPFDTEPMPVSLTGSVNFSSGLFTVSGSGEGPRQLITATTPGDQFQFANTFVDHAVMIAFNMVVRVDTMSSANANAFAGLDIAQNTGSNDAEVVFGIQPNTNTLYFYNRPSGASLAIITPVTVAAPTGLPIWLKLSRDAGSNINAYYSTDGSSWILVAGGPIPVANVQAGLAVYSGDGNTLNTATFDSLCIYCAACNTPTPVLSATQTETATETFTPSQTATPSQTLTPSETLTPSQTLTSSQTVTPSLTSSQTLTQSLTITFTTSPTVTITPVIGPLDVNKFVSFPNPVTTAGTIKFYYWLTTSDTEIVTIRIYTTAMRLIKVLDNQPTNYGDNYTTPWDLRDMGNNSLANGVYYYKLDAIRRTDHVTRYNKLSIVR